MSQIKEQDKITVGDLSKTEINNMQSREFKVMLRRILTGLQKGMEGISETYDKEIKNNISEMTSINKIKNTINGINSRIQETEVHISDLEDRVMESN